MIYIFSSIGLILIIGLIIFMMERRKNRHSKLYIDGVRHENNGDYFAAIENYRNAMNEMVKAKGSHKQVDALAKRIKTLDNMIAFEKKFQNAQS